MASSTSDPFMPLHEGLKKALAQGTGTDLKIKCGLREWSVHKLIVSAWSPFFFCACYSKFKESSENIIKLDEDDPNAVDAMIYFMYRAELATWHPIGEHQKFGGLAVYVQASALADKYDIPTLVEAANAMFAVQAKEQWMSQEFANAALEVFTSPSSRATAGLRNTILEVAKVHARQLLEDSESTFYHVVSTVPTLGADLSRHLALDQPKTRSMETYKFKCPTCAGINITERWSSGRSWCMYCGMSRSAGEWLRYLVQDE